jgi:hypothetical protein
MLERSRLGGMFALGVVLALSRNALAGDATLAESLFREGKALMEAGDYARGCPKLEESYRQDPSSGTVLALAFCQEQAGQTAAAWGSYNAAAVRARQDGRSDREQAARERAAALEPKLSKLEFQLSSEVMGLPGIVVKRDGKDVPRAAWGSPMPVDPGEHVIEVTADGKKPFRMTVRVGAEADRQTIEVTRLENAGNTGDAVAAPQDAPAASAPSKSALPMVGLVTAGVGAVGLGVGTVFALRASSLDEESKADGHCDAAGCDDKGYELNQDALGAARLSTVLFIAGGALVAGGLTLYFVAGSRDEQKASSLVVSPVVAHNAGGLFIRGGF